MLARGRPPQRWRSRSQWPTRARGDRVVDADSQSIVRAYESRTRKLEGRKIEINARSQIAVARPVPSTRHLEPPSISSETGINSGFPSVSKTTGPSSNSPLVSRLTYVRNEGFRTPDLSLPFKVGKFPPVKVGKFPPGQKEDGAPGEIRTSDGLVRSRVCALPRPEPRPCRTTGHQDTAEGF